MVEKQIRGRMYMHTYIWVVKQAVFFFPLIAFLITIPYRLHNYHKYGSVILAKTVIVYSFILYLLCAYFLVILPLPSRESVLRMTSPRMQLIPLHFIQDVLSEAHKLSGYARFLRNPAVFQFLFFSLHGRFPL